MRVAVLAAALLCTAPLGSAAPARAQTWLFESAATVPSTDTGWDYITLDQTPGAGRLFVARRADGLMVWNTTTRQAVTVENSRGANGVVLTPGRGFVAMTDGTMLSFDPRTLKPIDRVDLGVGDLNQGFYEPTQNRVHMITAAGPEKSTWVTLDATSGEVLGRTEFNSRKMDTPATDGEGAIYAPMRDKSLLQQLDAKDLSLQKTWKLGDCVQPVVVEWDAATKRVLIACRGDKPVFVALNPATGIVATVPIGRGVDGMAIDTQRHLVVTSNGEGTLSVIKQDGPDSYTLVETIATRPMARVLQLDEHTGRLFTVAASFTQPAPGADGKVPPPFYHPDSFSILTYRAH